MPMLTRPRLFEEIRSASAVALIHAPAGWGKSVLLERAARSDLRLVPVALEATEGHPTLFVEALAQGLRKAYPGVAVGAVRAAAALRGGEDPAGAIERVREALGAPVLTLGLDEVERLPRGPVWELVKRLIAERPATLRIVLTSRVAQPELLPPGATVIGPLSLGLNAAEVEAHFVQDVQAQGAPPIEGPRLRQLARAVLAETGGWPALVAARARASTELEVPRTTLVAAFGPVVDEAVAHLRSEARYVLQIAAIAGRFERSFMQTLLTGDVPGPAEARRRLIRLEGSVIARVLVELEQDGLLLADGSALMVPAGERIVLGERLLIQDQAAWLEAHRRAGEILLAQAKAPGIEVVDFFAAAEERERLLEILSRHGPGLELALAERGAEHRMLAWLAALEGSQPVPFWADVLAALAHARRGDADKARERLDKAREKLAFERREGILWRWQPRLAEAAGLVARKKGDYVDARSFFARGLDQLEQTRRRGLSQRSEEEELAALSRRMLVELARISRESAGWDKVKEASNQALAALVQLEAGAARPELVQEQRVALLLGGLAAGDVATLAELAGSGDAELEPVAVVLLEVLKGGRVPEAIGALRRLAQTQTPGLRSLAALCLARLLGSTAVAGLAGQTGMGDEVPWALEVAQAADEPWASWLGPEVAVRRRRTTNGAAPQSGEGWLGAVAIELQAPGPGKLLDQARDAYRRIGARWDEARLLVTAGAAASRRVDDGDGEPEAVAKLVEALVELTQAGGFSIPWCYAGRGEIDPERRIRTLLIAGLRHGPDKVRQLCRAELEALGVDTRTVTAPVARPRGSSGVSRRPAASNGAPFVIMSRTTSQGLSASDYQQLIATKGPGSFVVCVPDQLVLNYGRVVALGQKRVMLPLLLHLLRNPDNAYSMLELAREVWDSTELTPTVQTKVKVAISRLRALLGKNRNYITTTRKDEEGESVVAYQVAPQLQFQIVEQVTGG